MVTFTLIGGITLDYLLHHPPLVLLVSALVLLLAVRLGVAAQRLRPLQADERDDFDVVLGATLTLLALIIGFTFSMAVSRYDQRKNYEEAEANAIGTEYLRLDFLPATSTITAKSLLAEYLHQRIEFYQEPDDDRLALLMARAAQLEAGLWSLVRSATAAQPTAVLGLTASGMNDVFNSADYTEAAWHNRIPQGAWLLLAAIAMFCGALIGYGARTRTLPFAVLPLLVSVAFFLIADIDTPRHGLIRVTPDNLHRLEASLGRR